MSTVTRAPEEPYVSHDGTVYLDHHILHPTARGCRHENAHVCRTCDHDGYYAKKFGDACPWSKEEL